MNLLRVGKTWGWVVLALWMGVRAQAQGTNAVQTIELPKALPDPIEPFNRTMWEFNKIVLTDVVKPTAKVYRAVVVKPVRVGIGNMGTNATFPDRLLNNLLEGKWRGVRDETYRFLCNSTFGVAGFFDVASKWNIGRSSANFEQTFAQWGWKPNFFLMLPLIGPTDDKDGVGLAADWAANPLLYFDPATLNAQDPFEHEGPYSIFTSGVMYNNLSDTVDEDVRFSQTEMDPYAEIQYAWKFQTASRAPNYQVKGKKDPASLETLESVFFSFKSPKFPDKGRTRSARIPTTGRRLKFTYWLQPEKAPVVYIIPGLGSHRLADTSLALAELIYDHGFTVVSISSPFHSEFMAAASTAAVPGYLPVDGQDLQVALGAVDQKLSAMYPGRLDGRELMGYSMGAFETLYIASTERTNPAPPVKFDRFVAVNTPVQLLHGVDVLDQFYQAPLAWPAAERESDLQNTLVKVATLSGRKLTPQTSLPFDAVESKFLVGLDFRFILRDIIYSSQRRDNLGVLGQHICACDRRDLYQDIMRYSYEDYFSKFVVPYYQSRGLTAPAETITRAGNLQSYAAGLRDNTNVWAIVNQNDFLLAKEDLPWLRATLAPKQLTVFKEGGHLGNLTNPSVQKTILGALEGLKSPYRATSGAAADGSNPTVASLADE